MLWFGARRFTAQPARTNQPQQHNQNTIIHVLGYSVSLIFRRVFRFSKAWKSETAVFPNLGKLTRAQLASRKRREYHCRRCSVAPPARRGVGGVRREKPPVLRL